MALALDPVAAPEQPSTVYRGPGWTLAQRLAFRFVFVYLVLYILPFPISTLDSLIASVREIVTGEEPDPEPSLISQYVTKPYAEFWDDAVLSFHLISSHTHPFRETKSPPQRECLTQLIVP